MHPGRSPHGAGRGIHTQSLFSREDGFIPGRGGGRYHRIRQSGRIDAGHPPDPRRLFERVYRPSPTITRIDLPAGARVGFQRRRRGVRRPDSFIGDAHRNRTPDQLTERLFPVGQHPEKRRSRRHCRQPERRQIHAAQRPAQ